MDIISRAQRAARGDVPPKLYQGDLGWTRERCARKDGLYRAYELQEISTEEAVRQLAALITETEGAILAQSVGGKDVVRNSEMMQDMLYIFYTLYLRLRKG